MQHRKALAATAAVALMSGSAAATPPPKAKPPTAAQAEELARLYAGAVNDKGGVAPYMARDVEPVPPEVIAHFFDELRWMHGGMDLIGARVRPGAPEIVEAAFRSRLYGGVQGVELTVKGDPPKVTYFDLTPAPAWAAARTPRLSTPELASAIEKLVDKGCAADRFAGAVLVAAGDKVLVRKACGEASRRYHAANTPETRFNLGSMDKMFTAVAVMQLAEAGKVSLDATLDRYLDDTWLDPEVARKVTVWQLLTHTSGLAPDVVEKIEAEPRERFRELDDYRRLVRASHLGAAPGAAFEYSNTGFLLLGTVIAKASGQDYFHYVRDHIFAPAGMEATGSYAADDPMENLAMGYWPAPASPRGWRENSVRNLLRGFSAGGGYSTVGDLHRFSVALNAGRLVSQASLDRLWADGDRNNYGAGFEINQGAVGRAAGHSGLFYGVSTRMRIYQPSGYVVIVLSNMNRAAPPLVDAIEGELVRAPSGE